MNQPAQELQLGVRAQTVQAAGLHRSFGIQSDAGSASLSIFPPCILPGMADLHLTYLNRPDVEALELSDDEILRAVEGGLRAQGSARQ